MQPCLRWALLFAVLALTSANGRCETPFKGQGLCQFALEGFTLSPQSEASINQAVQRLLEQHQSVFGFDPRPGFRVRMRVYSRFEDFTNAPAIRALGMLQGVYLHESREIVTWRQEMPGVLGTTLLHEASHAIMHAHFRRLPVWLLEGVAEYFAYLTPGRNDFNSQALRKRWALLNLWLREGKLPSLPSLLNSSQEQWKKMEPDQAYAMSWSLFQFLMGSDANQRMMKQWVQEWQEPGWPPPGSAEQVARLYPGGLKGFENAWHRWIDRTGTGDLYKVAFHGGGLCQFALQGSAVSPSLEASVNQQAQALFDRHRALFDLPRDPAFHLRVRLFGDEEGYARFTTNWMVSGYDVQPGELARLDGYYSPLSKEIVMRDIKPAARLVQGLLELANVAILSEHFRKVPRWARLGSFQSLAAPGRRGQDEDEALALAWRSAGLPSAAEVRLRPFLDEAARPWEKEDVQHHKQAEAVSWALFRFLSHSEKNRPILRALLGETQRASGQDLNGASQIDRLYAGGWAGFETDFRQWMAGLSR